MALHGEACLPRSQGMAALQLQLDKIITDQAKYILCSQKPLLQMKKVCYSQMPALKNATPAAHRAEMPGGRGRCS